MTILDRANAFIGHEQEVDEGYETTMRRNAFIAGFKEALGIVKNMREAQAEQEVISARLMYIREHKGVLTDKDFLDVASITNKVVDLEDEVDELIKETV